MNNIAIFGQGEAACNIISTLNSLFDQNTFRFIVSDTNEQTLNTVGGNVKKIQLGSGVGAGMNPKIAESFVSKQQFKDELTKSLDGVEVCFCVAGFGGGTGSAISNSIEHIKSLDIPVYCIATTPFQWELAGESVKQENTNYAIQELKKQDISYQLFNNEILVEKFGDSDPFEAFRKSDIQVAKCLEAVLQIIITRSFPNIDINDIKRFLTHAKGEAIFNVGEGDTLEESMQAAQDMSFLTHRNFKQITGLISMSTTNDGRVTLSEFSSQLSKLTQKLSVGAINKGGIGRSDNDKIRTYILIGGLDNVSVVDDVERSISTEERIKNLKLVGPAPKPPTKPVLGARKTDN